MKTHLRIATALTALCGIYAIVIGSEPPPSTTTKPSQIIISSEEIGKSVVIHGKLNRPLGEIVTITGKCSAAPDPKSKVNEHSLFITVVTVDGVALKKQVLVEISQHPISRDSLLKPKKAFAIQGYEGGYFVGVPQEAMALTEIKFATVTGYSFETYFYAVTVKEL